jgi:hypothetical protein
MLHLLHLRVFLLQLLLEVLYNRGICC